MPCLPRASFFVALIIIYRDVRTREAGIQDIHHQVQPDEVELIRRDYSANGGWETFLAYEDPRQVRVLGCLVCVVWHRGRGVVWQEGCNVTRKR